MSRETASRDVALNALSLLTGGLTAVALIGTGYVTGLAADHTNQNNQAKAAAKAAAASQLAAATPLVEAAVAQPTPTPLPTRTVVTTRIVQAKAPAAQGRRSKRQSVGKATFRSSVRGGGSHTAAPAPARVRAPARAVAPAPSAAS